LVVSNTAESSLANIRPVNDRILVAEFCSNSKTTIIINYAPTEGSEGVEEHYKTLTETVNAKHNLLLVLGDFNARLGNDFSLHTFHQVTNGNGRLLQELCEETGLLSNQHIIY